MAKLLGARRAAVLPRRNPSAEWDVSMQEVKRGRRPAVPRKVQTLEDIAMKGVPLVAVERAAYRKNGARFSDNGLVLQGGCGSDRERHLADDYYVHVPDPSFGRSGCRRECRR